MKTRTGYNFFKPPIHLARKERCDWTRSEADQYLLWFQQNLTRRVRGMLAYLDEKLPQNPDEDDIKRIGGKVAAQLKTPEFSGNGDLTNAGYALAADMGLLMATVLKRVCPFLEWTVVRKPRNHISYNLPVLKGFGEVFLDPVQVSIAQAFGVLNEGYSGDVWRKVFVVWKDMAEDSSIE